MGLFKSKKKQKDSDCYKLAQEILVAKKELNAAISNFNYADKPDLIEYYSEQITLAQKKYDILTKMAKSDNMRYEGNLIVKVEL